MPSPNAKSVTTSAAAGDLGITNIDQSALENDEEKRKRLLQMQQERMGMSGAGVFGAASAAILGG